MCDKTGGLRTTSRDFQSLGNSYPELTLITAPRKIGRQRNDISIIVLIFDAHWITGRNISSDSGLV